MTMQPRKAEELLTGTGPLAGRRVSAPEVKTKSFTRFRPTSMPAASG